MLHARLIAGDRTASAAISEIFLPLLLKRLEGFEVDPGDRHVVEQAAIDALVSYLGRPQQYDPGELDLLGYLVMSAKGDARNAYDSARRRARREVDWQQGVANGAGDSEYEAEYRDENDFVAALIENESNVYVWLAERLTSATDYAMVELMLEGVHRTEQYAIVLGITHLPAAEQARTVKQNKDRIKARLRRSLDPEAIRAEARGND